MAGALTRRLITAVYEGRSRKVETLLQRGASPCAADESGETPLYLATVSGHTEIVRLLLEAGATPDTESRGQPGSAGLPLCAAASWGHDEVVRELPRTAPIPTAGRTTARPTPRCCGQRAAVTTGPPCSC